MIFVPSFDKMFLFGLKTDISALIDGKTVLVLDNGLAQNRLQAMFVPGVRLFK